jgi:hypothetical protein
MASPLSVLAIFGRLVTKRLPGITAWTLGAGWAVENTLTATIAESVCEIRVSETEFDPATAPAVQGDTIGWTIMSGDSHRLKDRSGMGLFDSGRLRPVLHSNIHSTRPDLSRD